MLTLILCLDSSTGQAHIFNVMTSGEDINGYNTFKEINEIYKLSVIFLCFYFIPLFIITIQIYKIYKIIV